MTSKHVGFSSEHKEHNDMGISDCSSSVDSSAISIDSEESRSNLNYKATELRLGLPGSQSPRRDVELSSSEHEEKQLSPLHPLGNGTSFRHKNIVLGNKRGFCEATGSFCEGNFVSDQDVNVVLSPKPSSIQAVKPGPLKDSSAALVTKMKVIGLPDTLKENPANDHQTNGEHMSASNYSRTSTPKSQVVGWPPIRSFRKTSLASLSDNTDEAHEKVGPGILFVKVSMDGAPYLRKVNLKAYATYQELSSVLQKMFDCFTIGQCTSHVTAEKEIMSETKLKDLVHVSEYVLTYEDKDGDWMLVGDVPWGMFVGTCKRLRIMKGSDAIGLAPRAISKCRSRT